MGCQCRSCKNDNILSEIEKHCHSLIQYRNSSYFQDKFMPEEIYSNWNDHYIYKCNTFLKIFDPLYGSYKESRIKRNLRERTPIEFSDLWEFIYDDSTDDSDDND